MNGVNCVSSHTIWPTVILPRMGENECNGCQIQPKYGSISD